MQRSDERILAELLRREDLELASADALDVKASIVLLLITFLGTESAYFIEKHLTGFSLIEEKAGIFFLALSLAASVFELWPRTYSIPNPSSTISRVEELEVFYAEDYAAEGWARVDSATVAQLTVDQIRWCQKRLLRNQKNNRIKAQWLNIAFYTCSLALFLNLVTLFRLSAAFH